VKLVYPVGFITKKFVRMHGHTNIKNLSVIFNIKTDERRQFNLMH